MEARIGYVVVSAAWVVAADVEDVEVVPGDDTGGLVSIVSVV